MRDTKHYTKLANARTRTKHYTKLANARTRTKRYTKLANTRTKRVPQAYLGLLGRRGDACALLTAEP